MIVAIYSIVAIYYILFQLKFHWTHYTQIVVLSWEGMIPGIFLVASYI